jgi:tagatose 1,6-diphosphate aldolase
MTHTITPGKWFGLKRTSLEGDAFAIVAYDQRGSYRKMLPANTSFEEAVAIKQEIVGVLAQQASAVLLDPDYGMVPAMHMSRHSGLLLSVEKSGYSGDSTYRKTEYDPAWTVAKIKQAGGTAVKLMAYYHPGSGELAAQIEADCKRIADECKAHDLPLFLEPMSYSLDPAIAKESAAYAATRPQVVIETAKRMSQLGADVLKLEFPYDAAFHTDQTAWREACEAISAASAIPWVLLSAGVEFEIFADQARIACQAGASGFLAGRAIWKEAVVMSAADRAAFLQQKAAPRLRTLIEISQKESRPWTTFYTPPTIPHGWYESYALGATS